MARKSPATSAAQPGPNYQDIGTTVRLLQPFFLLAALDLLGVALGSPLLQWLSKPFLAPVLLLLTHAVRDNRGLDRVAVGLLFACGGDVALLLEGETAFLAGMACFLGTQVAFIGAFLHHGRPPATSYLVYLPCWAAANALLWTPLGPLAVPVLGYSLALTVMAIAATGVSARVAVGGLLFLISDGLIGIGVAGASMPGHGVAVMVTYIAALLLITTGWVTATPGR